MEELHSVWTAIISFIGCWQLGTWAGKFVARKLFLIDKCDKCGRLS